MYKLATLTLKRLAGAMARWIISPTPFAGYPRDYAGNLL